MNGGLKVVLDAFPTKPKVDGPAWCAFTVNEAFIAACEHALQIIHQDRMNGIQVFSVQVSCFADEWDRMAELRLLIPDDILLVSSNSEANFVGYSHDGKNRVDSRPFNIHDIKHLYRTRELPQNWQQSGPDWKGVGPNNGFLLSDYAAHSQDTSGEELLRFYAQSQNDERLRYALETYDREQKLQTISDSVAASLAVPRIRL